MTDTYSARIDPERSVCLDQEGLPGFRAVTAVDADGNETLWLYRSGTAEQALSGCACPECAPHDQEGRLPARYRHKLTHARCGHPCANGRPCKAMVTEPGRLCPLHREQGAHR